jgi:hypothetical protein
MFRRALGVAEAIRLPGILDFGFQMEPGTVVSPIAGDADRPGHVVATGDTREQAMENADRAIASVRYVMN